MVSHSLCQPALPVHPAHLCPQPRLDCAWFTHRICPSRAVVLDVHAEGVIVSFATEACHPAFLGGGSAQRILSFSLSAPKMEREGGRGNGERERRKAQTELALGSRMRALLLLLHVWAAAGFSPLGAGDLDRACSAMHTRAHGYVQATDQPAGSSGVAGPACSGTT